MISNGGTSTLGLYDFKKQLDAFGGVDYFRSTLAGGYLPNARVMLDNGEIVQNKTVGNLTNNPNSDMSGWISDKTFVFVSVADYGAKPTNIASENDVAFSDAIADMNSKFNGLDGFLHDTPSKGVLLIPADGTYEISSTFEITGNYSLLLCGTINYVGFGGVTVFTIGRQVAFDSTADNDYLLNMVTSVANVDAFELKNMVDCRVTTMKIKGFKEALRCLARDSRGFFGNTFRLGTFDSNIIDIHIRSESSGSPNANRFYDGFFYKQRNMIVEQNCVKVSSDGTYNDIDSNLFDGLNFEEGKATEVGKVDCIPINLEVGTQNRFINIRTENNSNTALARVNKRGNIIQTRAAFTTSTEIISSNIQHTLVIPQNEMQRVFTSGDLARESVKLQTSGRIYNRSITFNDVNVLNQNSTVSTSAATLFDLTNGGIKFLNTRSMLSFKVKTNGDRRFLLRTFAEDTTKQLNVAIACYDSAGTRLGNDVAIATGTWGVQQRVKSNDNVPLAYSANVPWFGTGAYITPISTFQTRLPFEIHPSVATIEVYYIASATSNDITISHFELYSVEGNTSPFDTASPTPTTGDRWLYQAGRGYLTFNLAGSGNYDPPSLTNGTSATQTFSLLGAALGDIITTSFSNDLQGVTTSSWVSSYGIVSIRFTNNTGGTIDLASGTVNMFAKRLVF